MPEQRRSIKQLQNQFVSNWFPGGEAFTEPIISIHDAAHQYANINPTSRGELQQQIVDAAGTQMLGETIGAQGFVNAAPAGGPPIKTQQLKDQVENLQELSKMIAKQSMFGNVFPGLPDINSPARFVYPALSNQEINELQKRGREFYGKVGDSYLRQVNAGRVPAAQGTQLTNLAFTPAENVNLEVAVNPQALAIHQNPNVIKVTGGYDKPGQFTYGPMMQRMNSPMEIMVDQPDWAYAGKEYLTKDAFPGIQESYPGSDDASIKKRMDARGKYRGYGNIPIEDRDYLEASANSPIDFNEYVRRQAEGLPTSTAPNYAQLEQEQLAAFNTKAKELPYKSTEYSPEQFTASTALQDKSLQRAYDKLFAVAKNRGNLRNIIKGATTAAGDIAGSVPLFDPEFRQAVETNNLPAAAGIVARDYAIGTAAAPVVGMGVGALNQVAPRAAQVVSRGLNAARVANPIAVTSQLGGSAKINPAADKKAIQSQLQRAQAARQRGGKWKLPTPFGTFTVPELGISEAGGLFFP